jgi:hypothetical protein
MLQSHQQAFLLLVVTFQYGHALTPSPPAVIFANTASQNSHAAIVLPSFFQNRFALRDKPSSMKVSSQVNLTAISRRHPFACWESPNFFSSQKKTYASSSRQSFDMTCWTRAIAVQNSKRISQAAQCDDNEILWFRTSEQCWVPEFNINSGDTDDMKEKLKYCPPPLHMVGGFQAQYKGKSYCYSCTKLDCPPKPKNHERSGTIGLNCWTVGNDVGGDE